MTRWYLAEIVQQITVAGDERAVVHINWVLVEAGSPDDAYAKALELGAQDQDAYANSTGRRVTVRFRGLRNLYVIHDALVHGAELLYEERVGLSETEIAALVRPRPSWRSSAAPRPRRGPILEAPSICCLSRRRGAQRRPSVGFAPARREQNC